jgi:DNA-binding SARP family transcriptional activator
VALDVRLFGELVLTLGREQLAPVESTRARSLLGYLLLHAGAPVSRQHLAFLLWPDSTEPQARTNLRKVLHLLRRDLPEIERHLHVTPRTLAWREDTPCVVDVARFQSAIAEADGAEVGSEEAVAALRAAVSLYQGDLLEDCYDEWVVEERERLRDRHVAALRRLSDLLADRGEYPEAVRIGRELLRCDPLQEDTYRLLMRVHDQAGDRAAALRVYHECVSTLQRELGVDPSKETNALYSVVTSSEERSASDEAGVVPLSSTVLVGRGDEWNDLVSWWREAEGGKPRLVLVTGEAGVGKTRLLEELGESCARRGAVVAQARSYPAEGELGYAVAVSWLRTVDLAAQVRRAEPPAIAVLALLLPELGAVGQDTSEPLDRAERRRRLFDAVAGIVKASGRPVLLVADDAQWCDAQSLQLLHYLVRSEPSLPLLVVASARREELDAEHPLAVIFGALGATEKASEVPLGRLTRSGTAALARHLAGGHLTSASIDELHTETEGNPLFIVETVRAGSTGGGGGLSGLTPKLHAVINGRLQRLSEPARELLGLAATVGRAFTTDLLTEASGADDLTLVRSLDELWRHGVIREQGIKAYDFTHGRICDVADEALCPGTRRRNHLLVAEALQRLHAGDLDSVSRQVSRHYECAGRPADAVRWYLSAARQAQRLHADHEAVRILERARELVSSLPADARLRNELEVLSALPAALVGVEGFASSRLTAVQQRALEVAGSLGMEPVAPLLRSLVMSRLCRHDFGGARAAAKQLRHGAERTGDVGLVIESEYLLGITAFWGGQLPSAREHLERVVERFRTGERSEHLVRFGHDPAIVCLSRLGNTFWLLGRDDAARKARDTAVAMAIALGHPYTRGAAYGFGVLLSIDLGEEARIREYLEALSREEHQIWPTELCREAIAGYVDMLDGRPAAGIDRIHATVGRCGPVDPAPGVHAYLMRVLLAAYDAAHDAERGLAATNEALSLSCSRLWEAEIRRLRAEFHAATGGSSKEVAAELTRGMAVARDQGAAGLERRIERSRSRLGLA